MNDNRLKECPFCGGEAYLTSHYSNRSRRYFIMVKCASCGSTGRHSSSAQDPFIEDWNDAACNQARDFWNMRSGVMRDDNDPHCN